MNARRAAFTLIELLVVIAIISLLAALLFPAFVGAREKGRQTVCANNLKQISTAFLLYHEDWDEAFPAYHRIKLAKSTNGCGFSCHWSPQLAPFIKPLTDSGFVSDQRRGNVSNVKPGQAGTSTFICPSATNDQNGSYAMNLNLGYRLLNGGGGGGRPTLTNSESVSLVDVKSPTTTVLIYDTPTPENQSGNPDWWGERWSQWGRAMPGDLAESPLSSVGVRAGQSYLRPRHGGGNMVSFVDGHVKWVRNIAPLVSGGKVKSSLTGTEGFKLQ